jgi:hypothetical protein
MEPMTPQDMLAAEQPSVPLQIVSLTSPVTAGNFATLVAQTEPGARCGISVTPSESNNVSGLETKTADSTGNVSWTWLVVSPTPHGTWPIVVMATSNGTFSTQTAYLVVQ